MDAHDIGLNSWFLWGFEDLKLNVVILEPWSLALTQEHSLIMGSDVTQGQSSHRVLEAKAVLIFTRFPLALALVHTENQYLPLLVNQKPVHLAEVA